MNPLRARLLNSPAAVRVVPFVVFVALTALQGQLGATSPYWMYLLKTLVGVALIWATLPAVAELRWRITPAAVLTGVAVFAVWVGLDPFYPKLTTSGEAWNPHRVFGDGAPLAWFFIAVRILGSTLVVPCLEEVFYRSFLYRSIARADFQAMPLGQFAWLPFLATSAAFGLAHREWLAGLLCAAAYQGLVCWRKNLGEALTAHAVTNLLLGLYVVTRGAWNFW